MNTQDIHDIREYYRFSDWLYRLFWSPQKRGMHVGFWGKGIRSVDEAVEQENVHIMRLAQIKPGMNILDAGCGMGSVSVCIAKESGAHVTGVSLIPQQIAYAKQYAKQNGVSDDTTFRVADYTNLPFPDASFDAVVGVESICYAYPKDAFLKEAYRVLKPGGRLVFADPYMKRAPHNTDSQSLHDAFCASYALKELTDPGSLKKKIQKAGFGHVRWLDETKRVVGGAKQYFMRYRIFKPLLFLLSRFPSGYAHGIVRNAEGGYVCMQLLTTGIGCYGIFTARK